MHNYIGGVAAGLVLVGAGFATVPATFAASQHHRDSQYHRHSLGQDIGDGNLVGAGQDYFLLTHYSTALIHSQARTYDMTVTVEQNRFDRDKTGDENHYFPKMLRVSWPGGRTTATWKGLSPGINYVKTMKGERLATAEYKLVLPPGTILAANTRLSMGPFYMVGALHSHSPDDEVHGSLINIPYGQLPEVPWAASLPAVGLGLGAAVWLRKRRILAV